MEKLHFGYWTDPLCVWAFVTEDRFERLRERYGDLLDDSQHVVPVFGSFPKRFAPGGKWHAQGPEGRMHTTARIAREHGHPEVSGQVWVDDTPSSSWSAGQALCAVRLLEHDGLAEEGATRAYTRAMRRAFFVDNLNITRRRAQLQVAEGLGLDRGAIEERLDDGRALACLWEDEDERQRLRIQGSPTYVFDGGRVMIYGNYAEAALVAAVGQLVEGLAVGASRC